MLQAKRRRAQLGRDRTIETFESAAPHVGGGAVESKGAGASRAAVGKASAAGVLRIAASPVAVASKGAVDAGLATKAGATRAAKIAPGAIANTATSAPRSEARATSASRE